MRTVKKILTLIVSLLMLSTSLFTFPVSKAASSSPIVRILYLGNSKTFYNGFPRMHENLSEKSEKEDVRFTCVAAGGRRLSQHADKLEAIHDSKGKVQSYKKVQSLFLHEDEYNAYVAAFNPNLDYVVLQAQLTEQKSYIKLSRASQRIINVLRKYGNSKIKVIYNAVWDQYPDTSIYTTFDEQMSQLEMEQNIINQNFTKVAEELGGTVSYSGQAVYNYIKTYPNEGVHSMYRKYLNHPTQAASYLSACCLYSAIHNESPIGISYYGAVKDVKDNPIIDLKKPADHVKNDENFTGRKELGNLDETLVGKLQQIAEQTMMHNSPTISRIIPNITSSTNKSVTLNAIASDSAFGLDSSAYSWDGITYSNNAKFKISKNGTYTLYVKNKIGKISSKKITINNIDKKPPKLSVSYSTTKKTNKNVTVTIKSNEPLQKLDGWSLSKDKLSLKKTYTKNTTGQKTIIVRDIAGNEVSQKIKISNIDKNEMPPKS